jgi:hypothetical protein
MPTALSLVRPLSWMKPIDTLGFHIGSLKWVASSSWIVDLQLLIFGCSLVNEAV